MTRASLLAVVLLLIQAPAWAATRSVVLEVPSMTCATCPITVRLALTRVEGVIEARVSWEPREAQVRYDDERTDVPALLAAIRDAGYPGRIKAPTP